jgi:micrococcal nuclease
MAGQRKRSKPKYSIATLILLLVIAVFYHYNVKDAPPPVDTHPTEAPAKKERKAKKPKRAKSTRKLTVFTGRVIGIKDGDTFEVCAFRILTVRKNRSLLETMPSNFHPICALIKPLQ